MGKLYTKARKYDPTRHFIKKVAGKDAMKKYDQTHVIGEYMKSAHDASTAAKAATKAAENEPAIPMADEEELARIRRRRALGGGRASTQLTGETFGP